MKRFLILLVASLLALPAAAQELAGVWTISEAMDETKDGMKSSMNMTGEMNLSANGTCSQTGNVTMTIGDGADDFHFRIVYSVSGTWKREGETLTIQNTPKTAKVDVAESNLPGVLKVFLVNTMKKELKKELSSKKPDVYAIISLTDDELVIVEQGAKNPEVETYKRKR